MKIEFGRTSVSLVLFNFFFRQVMTLHGHKSDKISKQLRN